RTTLAPTADRLVSGAELRRDRRPAPALGAPVLRERDHPLTQRSVVPLAAPALLRRELLPQPPRFLRRRHARRRAPSRRPRHDGARRDVTQVLHELDVAVALVGEALQKE